MKLSALCCCMKRARVSPSTLQTCGWCFHVPAGGKFCPNTTAMLDCPPGHFCKAGSSKATLCPPLLGCPANTETPTDNMLGVVLNGAMFLLLALTWQAMQLYHQLVRRLSRRERMKLMWNRQKNAPEVRQQPWPWPVQQT